MPRVGTNEVGSIFSNHMNIYTVIQSGGVPAQMLGLAYGWINIHFSFKELNEIKQNDRTDTSHSMCT